MDGVCVCTKSTNEKKNTIFALCCDYFQRNRSCSEKRAVMEKSMHM